MRSASVTYSKDFPRIPLTSWYGERWRKPAQTRGAPKRGKVRYVLNPYFKSRKLWWQLEISLDGIALVFSQPVELEGFLDVISQQAMPSVGHLTAGEWDFNRHWLSRLPAKAKTTKFRQHFIKFIRRNSPELNEFLDFYRVSSLRTPDPSTHRLWKETP